MDMQITVELPLVPHLGMMLKLTPGGDFMKVEEVMWDITTPDSLLVFMEEPDDDAELPSKAWLLEEGWRVG